MEMTKPKRCEDSLIIAGVYATDGCRGPIRTLNLQDQCRIRWDEIREATAHPQNHVSSSSNVWTFSFHKRS